ncbi:MAG TPA: helix-turn-helix transcriptional regulator, partial [Micromonospora sp.]
MLVRRPRLLERLHAGSAAPVTLVSAPAGWGKTVLLAEWYQDRADDRRPDWLDAGAPAAGCPFPSGGIPAPVGRPLVRELADVLADRPEPVTVVLDDLHRITDRDTLDGLDFLLRHSDGRLRLVVGCRRDPALALHRWRLADALTELRAEDLAFTVDETAELLRAHGVVLDPDRVAELCARTGGWPVGLRLAALALRDHPDPARFVRGYGGDHPDVAEYLRREVLDGLPDDLWDLLRRTAVEPIPAPPAGTASVLTGPGGAVPGGAVPAAGADTGRVGDGRRGDTGPTIPAGLVDALTDRRDGESALAALERDTGFLTMVQSRPPVSRCHRMLAELLRAELRRRPQEELADLHRRAAGWHAANGLPARALRHALAAGQWREATQILVEHWSALIPVGPVPPAVAEPDGDVRPPPDEAFRAVPGLALAWAADRLHAGDPAGAERSLRAARQYERPSTSGPTTPRSTVVTTALWLLHAQLRDEPAAVLRAADRLIALSGSTAAGAPEGDPDRRAARAGGHAARGAVRRAGRRLDPTDLAAAADDLDRGRAYAESVGLPGVALACTARLALVAA